MPDFFSAIFGKASNPATSSRSRASQDNLDDGIAIRYRASLAADIRRGHADASRHLRSLLDACRDHDSDAAIACLRQFADEFRQVGLTRSIHLYPYLRWALQRDRTATIQFEAVYRDMEQSTLLIEAILTEYLHSPWESDRRRRFVHVVVRVANLFSQSVRLETTVLLTLYQPPGQFRFVTSDAPA